VGDHERPEPGAEHRADLSGLGRLSERPPPPRRERAAPVVRGLSILLLAIAAAGLPWYFLTRGGSDPQVQSSPSPSGSASPTPTPTTTLSAATYEVFGVEACLNLRAAPSTSSERLDCLLKGIRLSSDGQTQQAGGLLWRHVHYAKRNLDGWVADRYLKPVS
jgi:hypothetical protein